MVDVDGKNGKMRILHVIPGLANSSGPTQALLNLALHEAKLGHHICLAHLIGRGTDGSGAPEQRIEKRGFQVLGLKHWGYSPSLGAFLHARVQDYDIVHVHSMWLYPSLAACRACMHHRVPYIIRPAGSLEPWALGFKRAKKFLYYHLIEREQINRSSAIHAASEQEAENIRRCGIKAPVIMIPNGIELEDFAKIPARREARRSLGLPESGPLILFLGRLHYVKGLDVLGEAFARVLARMPEARLAIVGPDHHEYAQKIRHLYRDLGIIDKTVFLGERRGDEKVAAYAAANVFVLPSRSENFGIAVAESLAAGTPVVVSNNTPWSQVEDAGAGYWAELEKDLFAYRILDILRDDTRARRMGEIGREMVAEHYSWERIAHRTIENYQAILHKTR